MKLSGRTRSDMKEKWNLNVTRNENNSTSSQGFEMKPSSCVLSGGSYSEERQVKGTGADKQAGPLSGHRA